MTARVLTTRRERVMELRLNRPDKLNAFDLQMLRELAEGMTRADDDPDVWCVVLCAAGDAFTAGLDLAEVGPAVAAGEALFPDGLVDPLGLTGRVRRKPLLVAVQGWCLTIGIELLLAADICVSAHDTRFGQIEVNRGIMPFGGATIRFPALAGWSNAMRWLLTGDRFDADQALHLGLVQEITDTGDQIARAHALAARITSRAPLAIREVLASARLARREGKDAAVDALLPAARRLMVTQDADEGMRSFVERRDARFEGE